MMKFILPLILFFSFIQINAQTINNRNVPINRNDLLKSSVSSVQIYSLIDRNNKDSIISRNFIANSDNYFDLTVIKQNKKKYYIIVTEYSPTDKEFKKFTEYEYNSKKDKLKYKHSAIMLPPAHSCIGIPSDKKWIDELKYTTLLNDEIYIHLIKELNMRQ